MLTVGEILLAVNGNLLNGQASVKIKGVCTDTRTLKKGELFVALSGDNFNGHHFVEQAVDKAAAAVLVCQEIPSVDKSLPVIYVQDTVKALGQLAAYHREKFDIPIIAITGSAGKTTTKEMIASVLSTKFKVLKSLASHNNHIGVPLTLLRLRDKHEMVVVEFGTNQFGDIRWLADIAQPTVSVLTNIGEAHLEGLKSVAGVLKEKSEIFKDLKKEHTVVFNNDDRCLNEAMAEYDQPKRSFGIKTKSDIQAKQVEVKDEWLEFQVQQRVMRLQTTFEHNVYNALAATAVARQFDMPLSEIEEGLKGFRFPKGRENIKKIKDVTLIDDTYNSNPLSLKSAIATLDRMNVEGRKIVVCGDMLELGKQARKLHCSIGDLLSQSSIDCLLTIGPLAEFVHKQANRSIESTHFESLDQLNERLKGFVQSGDAVLVKGSRATHMERTVEFLNEHL